MKLPIPAEQINLLADWFNIFDAERAMADDEVQRDLRALARRVDDLESLPEVVCLIGSTRFMHEYRAYNRKFTLAGKIVLTVGMNLRDAEDAHYVHVTYGSRATGEIKQRLDALHLKKILLADRVFCINRDGYIGESTRRELQYATVLGKPVDYLEPPADRFLAATLQTRAGIEAEVST